MLATCENAPYQAVLTGAKAGKHTLKAVATDNDGETSASSVEITLQASSNLTISSGFTEGGVLPAGWTTFDGNDRRAGYSNGYSQGCRVLQFTGSPRGLNYGLYFRNIGGQEHQGWAKYGLADGGTTLSLAPGHYTLKYKICNWNMSNYGAVELNIEKREDNTSIASQTYTPNVNIGNVASNSFANIDQQTFEFDVTEQGDYAIAVYSAASEWSDCIIGQLTLSADNNASTGIKELNSINANSQAVYDLQGRKVSASTKGLYIKNGKKMLKK